MQQEQIWLVILFFSRKKFHAKQICVLSSAMKLGPELLTSRLVLWEPTHGVMLKGQTEGELRVGVLRGDAGIQTQSCLPASRIQKIGDAIGCTARRQHNQ